jgi:hypothetical protein
MACQRCGYPVIQSSENTGRDPSVSICSNPWCPKLPAACPECASTRPAIGLTVGGTTTLECRKGHAWDVPFAGAPHTP